MGSSQTGRYQKSTTSFEVLPPSDPIPMNEVPATLLVSCRDALRGSGITGCSGKKDLTRVVRRLQGLSGTEDLSGCAKMSLQEGLDFCWSPWCGDMKFRFRATILRRFGFCHSDELEEVRVTTAQALAEWGEMGHGRRHSHGFRTYLDLAKWLGPSPRSECECLTEERLAQLVREAGDWTTNHFTVLKWTLVAVGRAEMVSALERSLHPSLTGRGSAQVWLCALSEWHATTLPKIVESYCHKHDRVVFERKRRTLESDGWRMCLHLRDAAQGLAPPNIENDPLRWFVETCDPDLVKRALLRILRQLTVRNDLVRSEAELHHASGQSIRYLSLMKSGLSTVRPDLDLSSITCRKLLREIPNQRVPIDSTTRRTLTLEAAGRLVQAARGSQDARATLVLVLLSEIGLRRSALCHLKYNNLLDRTHTPLCTGRALEKGRKWRCFVTSTRLKQAIKSYAETVRDVADAHSDGDFFLLNPKRPEKPLDESALCRLLRAYVDKAGITDIHVYPHMFRHSIVGWLVDAGNSMELASKYMGHANVQTTAQHYWVPNANELFSKINNPFTGEMQQQQREARQSEQELELLQGKLDGALHIIAQMDAVVRTAVASNLTAAQVQEAMARIPNRDAILRTILESTSASLTAASVPAPLATCEGIAEEDDDMSGEGDDLSDDPLVSDASTHGSVRAKRARAT